MPTRRTSSTIYSLVFLLFSSGKLIDAQKINLKNAKEGFGLSINRLISDY